VPDPAARSVAGSGPDWSLEAELWAEGYVRVVGVDEAGRGALAGPVVAAAVLLPVTRHPFVDSKTVREADRDRLAALVRERALCWAIGEATPEEVDALNVLEATKVAAERALRTLTTAPDAVVTDYLPLDAGRLARWGGPAGQRSPPRADARSFQVAAASLLAKTHRDAVMRAAAVHWPHYGFDRNKGYGAPTHLQALARFGPCPWHRRSFRPLAAPMVRGEEPDDPAEEDPWPSASA
jgi:ribonuclease HII